MSEPVSDNPQDLYERAMAAAAYLTDEGWLAESSDEEVRDMGGELASAFQSLDQALRAGGQIPAGWVTGEI